MFNRDFYPTPKKVINQMLSSVDVAGKAILEPSAGKGNIVDVLNNRGARQVCTFEKEQVLSNHVRNKSTFLGHDFFECKPEDVSHIDCIIMNPPFSADEKHILHAWNVAPEGCHIVSLCPENSLSGYSEKQRILQNRIDAYGNVDRHLGNCFSDGERKTDVNVSIVELFKPIRSDEFDFSGFFMDQQEQHNHPEGVIKHNEVRSLVSRYVGAMECFDKIYKANQELGDLIGPIGLSEDVKVQLSYHDSFKNKKEFGRFVQKAAWKYIFRQMNLERFVTSGVMENINRFVEKQTKYPFTMKNIYRMFEIIIGTREQTMEKALEEAFDQVTKHYDQNRYHVEGWKTNAHYMVKKKMILPHMVEENIMGTGLSFGYSSYRENVDDLNKALCWLTGKNENLGAVSAFQDTLPNRSLERGRWYDWSFFKIKAFKKGTLHMKFKDEKTWERFNRKVADIKGHPLPEAI